MWVRTKWVVLWSLWAVRLAPPRTAPVRLAGGALVRGSAAPDGSHERFLAIPYATVHPQRMFQAAGAAPRWRGPLAADDEHVRCPQRLGAGLVLGRLQCLVLNVFRPAQGGAGPPPRPLPVMVFVHGGGFLEGSGSQLLYGPDYLVAKGVVLVTFNYRLNLPGFLCLGTKEVPGNAGLKDQLAALKWVRQNIGAFGGDPDNVTIFGESAGAVSVALHVASPASRGLFRRAVAQSGAATAPWVLQRRPLHAAATVARALGYDTTDPRELYNIFMNTSISEILTAPVPRRDGEVPLAQLLYTPCVEQPVDGSEPFLTEAPYDLLSKGQYNKVPMIIGFNDEEGYFFAAMDGETVASGFSFEKALPQDLVFPSERERKEVAQRLRDHYMGNDEIPADDIVRLSKFYGEPFFQYPAVFETELILNSTEHPVYSYVLRYDGWRNFAKLISGLKFWRSPGATHADELFYLFSQPLLPALFEHTMIDRVTTMWTNFAKYGDPTPERSALLPLRWPRAAPLAAPLAEPLAAPSVLVLDSELGVAALGDSASMRLWREIYDNYRRR